MNSNRFLLSGLACVLMSSVASSQAADWSRFRGPNGTGVAADAKNLPSEFSAEQNLRWKAELPGRGSSSPIVVGDRVFVSCWSGYGQNRQDVGDLKQLKLHLVCFERATGKQLWNRTIDPYYPEEPYEGMFAEHGYASHTPVSDGHNVYVYFGKSGLYAFDLEGNKLWSQQVGTGADRRGWGSASSPILYKDLVIVTAAAEKQAIVAFHKQSGEVVWQQIAEGLAGTWGTPVLAQVDSERADLVIGVPYEIWGINPDTGKLRWYCEGSEDDSYCSSLVADGNTVFAVEGRSGGSFAVHAGGKGDVSKTHVVWSGSERNRIGSPIVLDGLVYFVSARIMTCLDAKTGKEVYKSRLVSRSNSSATSQPPSNERPGFAGRVPAPGPGIGGGGRGNRGGGGMGGQDYSSPVFGDGKLYYVARNGEIFVIEPGAKFEQLSVNLLTDQTEDFSASPAISDDQLFIRSSKHLYCVQGN